MVFKASVGSFKEVNVMKVEGRLIQKYNEHNGQREWALVSKKSGRVLRWFGAKKPSAERVAKEERRIWHFKTAGSLLEEILAEVPALPSVSPIGKWFHGVYKDPGTGIQTVPRVKYLGEFGNEHHFQKEDGSILKFTKQELNEKTVKLEQDEDQSEELSPYIEPDYSELSPQVMKRYNPENPQIGQTYTVWIKSQSDWMLGSHIAVHLKSPTGKDETYKLMGFQRAIKDTRAVGEHMTEIARYLWDEYGIKIKLAPSVKKYIGQMKLATPVAPKALNPKAEGFVDNRFEEEPTRQAFRDALPFEGPWNGYGQKHPMEKLYPLVSKVLADLVDPRYADPNSGYRRDSALPISDTYGWGLGIAPGDKGTATEINPLGQGVRRAFAVGEIPVCYNFKFHDLEDLRTILPQAFEQAGLEPYEKFYAALQKDNSLDLSQEQVKPGHNCQFFHFDGNKLMDSMEGMYRGEPMEQFDNLTDFFEWIIPLNDEIPQGS